MKIVGIFLVILVGVRADDNPLSIMQPMGSQCLSVFLMSLMVRLTSMSCARQSDVSKYRKAPATFSRDEFLDDVLKKRMMPVFMAYIIS